MSNDRFFHEARQENVFDEVVGYLNQIDDRFLTKTRSGSTINSVAKQTAFTLLDVFEKDARFQDEALDALLAFVKYHAELSQSLGQDAYRQEIGLYSAADMKAMVMERAKARTRGEEPPELPVSYLGNRLEELADTYIYDFRADQENRRIEALVKEAEDVRLKEHEKTKEIESKGGQEADAFLAKCRALSQAASELINKGKQIAESQIKRYTAISSNIRSTVKKAEKIIKSKSAFVKFKGYVESPEGQAMAQRFVNATAKVSLASRKAMGQPGLKSPSAQDRAIARRLLKQLLEGGSLDQDKIMKHIWSAREEAAKHVMKHSKSQKIERKVPSYAKVRAQLDMMNLDPDLIKASIKFDASRGTLNKTVAKKYSLEQVKEAAELLRQGKDLSDKFRPKEDSQLKAGEKVRVTKKSRGPKSKKQKKNIDDKSDDLDFDV